MRRLWTAGPADLRVAVVPILPLAAAAIPLWCSVRGQAQLSSVSIAPVLIFAALCVAERLAVPASQGAQVRSIDLAGAVMILGLLVCPPGWLTVAIGVATAITPVLNRRGFSVAKMALPLAEYFVLIPTAYWLMRAIIGAGDPVGPRGWLAAGAAMGMMLTATSGLVTLAISAYRCAWTPPARWQLLVSIATAPIEVCLGCLVAALAVHDPVAIVLLVLPAIGVGLAFRLTFAVRRQAARSRFLSAAGVTFNAARNPQSALLDILSGLRDLLSCQFAEVILISDGSAAAQVVAVAAERPDVVLQPMDHERAAALVRAADGGVQIGCRRDADPLVDHLAAHGYALGLAAPIHMGGRAAGVVIVAAVRFTPYNQFGAETLADLRTLATQIGSTMEARRLDQMLAIAAQERESLHVMAFTDPLTGLANRTLFDDRLAHALARQARAGRPVAVLFLDLDGFKAVNDSLGHAAGDELLIAVGARLRACVREQDTVARFGGDEFAVILEDLADAEAASGVAVRMLEQIAEPVVVAGAIAHVWVSIGVAHWVPGATGEELLSRADAAMYTAKQRGRNRYEVAGLAS